MTRGSSLYMFHTDAILGYNILGTHLVESVDVKTTDVEG